MGFDAQLVPGGIVRGDWPGDNCPGKFSAKNFRGKCPGNFLGSFPEISEERGRNARILMQDYKCQAAFNRIYCQLSQLN